MLPAYFNVAMPDKALPLKIVFCNMVFGMLVQIERRVTHLLKFMFDF